MPAKWSAQLAEGKQKPEMFRLLVFLSPTIRIIDFNSCKLIESYNIYIQHFAASLDSQMIDSQ